MKKLLFLTLCVGISGCAAQFSQERSTALYAALNQVTPGCDRTGDCIEQWDVARQLVQKNSVPNTANDSISSGDVFSLSDTQITPGCDRRGDCNESLAITRGWLQKN